MPFLEVAWSEHRHTIEYAWVNPEAPGPLWVFLHEGLGSVALWRGFPEELCRALGIRGLVFSRWGYGHSSPRLPEERWGPDFMHRQAREFLPAFFRALGLGEKPLWFYGHSDGSSIALIYAATFPEAVGGLVVVAPHVFVEEITLESIRRARTNYLSGDLRARLARYHRDPDSAFFGWNEAWLDPRFRAWDIRDLLPQIRAPILAIQCYGDEYGTMAQIEEIARLAPRVELCRLEGCGHSPHRDRPEVVIPFHADSFILGHQWKRVCLRTVAGSAEST